MRSSRKAFLSTGIAALAGLTLSPASVLARPTRAHPAPPPAPLRGLVTRWDGNPNAYGAYSALGVGGDLDARATLANTVIRNRIVLCGEHTSTTHPATVQGALASGEHAARLLARRGFAKPGKTILVIGAGTSGLAAAARLSATGAEVGVVEAAARIGGRIDTDTSWGAPIELGAAWVHGVKGNPLPRLLIANGASLVPTDYEDQTIRTLNGEAADVDRANARLERIVRRLESREHDPDLSVRDALDDADYPNTPIASYLVETSITQEYGVDPRRLSANAYYEGAEQEGGDALVKGGYSTVPRVLAEGQQIRLDTRIRTVETTTSGAIATTTSGERLAADAIIVSVPLGVLKRRALRIRNTPAPIADALDSLVMGDLEKCILQYPTRWWPDTTGLGIVGAPRNRWSEWFDLTPLVGAPTIAGFCAASSARTRPASDAACIRDAHAVLASAFANEPGLDGSRHPVG